MRAFMAFVGTNATRINIIVNLRYLLSFATSKKHGNFLVLFRIFSFFENLHVSLFINSSSYASHISLYINIFALINAFDHSLIRIIWNCLIHFIGNFMLVKIL